MALPNITTAVPGPRSLRMGRELSAIECPEVTYVTEDFPVFWRTGEGSNVWDVDGNRYLDISSSFGVCGLGHRPPSVCDAIAEANGNLLHGMGDVHPPEAKLAFLRSLAEFLPAELGNILLSCNGSDACESALKTAQIHTGRSQFLAFTGSYHGLGYGALSVTHKSNFRIPFRARLLESDTHFARFPNLYREGKEDGRIILEQVDFLLSGREIAGLIIEPIQGRGGVLVPPEGFLPELRKLCHKYGTLLIFDEIYTGLYRTGTKLACLHENVLPDLLCLGKLLGGGLPLSACVGKPSVMASWGRSEGEAIHTSTFLGNPLICRAGEAVIKELQSNDWASIVSGKGTYLESLLRSDLPKSNIGDIRGRGLLWGIELVKQGGEPSPELARYIVKAGLKRGLILLPGGSYGNVLTLSPPFVISHVDLDYLVSSLAELLMNGQASL